MNIQQFKQKLEEEKRLLEEELKDVGKPNPLNPSDWEAKEEPNAEKADLNTQADVYEEIEERHAITDTLEARLQNVNAALARIGEGSYGVCEVCGERIEEDRLNANPAARTCKAHLNN